MPRHNTEADFWSRVQMAAAEECWPWIGPVTDRGYGKTHYLGRERRAHQVAFFLKNGFYPPATLHKCDNPPCCNPRHLFAGTNGTNNGDRAAKGRSWHPRNEAHPACKLTDEQVREMRALYPSQSYTQLGKQFGIHPVSVGQIIRGERRQPC